jgi:hypothetical protein
VALWKKGKNHVNGRTSEKILEAVEEFFQIKVCIGSFENHYIVI